MFRPMRRFKQQIADSECKEILKNEKRGVLSLLGDDGYRKEGEWALNINSVIAFGKIRLGTDEELARKICTKLVQKFTDDQEYLEKELKNALPRVQCLELEIEHMTGKLVNES